MLRLLFFLVLSLFVLGGCQKRPPPQRAVPAASTGLDDAGRPRPSTEDRCPMCGMAVLEHPQWVGAIQLDDGSTYYFCSVRCTLATARHPDKFMGVGAERLRRVRVPDYLHPERSLDADTAIFVTGSTVRGPMGVELVPAGSPEDAEVILRRHGGRTVRRAEVDDKLLLELRQASQPR